MQPHTKPCEMCGKSEDEYERQKLERETKKERDDSFYHWKKVST